MSDFRNWLFKAVVEGEADPIVIEIASSSVTGAIQKGKNLIIEKFPDKEMTSIHCDISTGTQKEFGYRFISPL